MFSLRQQVGSSKHRIGCFVGNKTNFRRTDIIDAYKKGGYPAGDTKYTVFGQVIKGMDVVDTIGNLEVDDNSKPKENVTVNSVEVVKDYKFK